VYLTDAELMRPRARERVHCFDEATGKPLWTHSYAVDYQDHAFEPPPGMGPVATPVVSSGKLYTLGSLGHLCCLDATNGHVLWEKALDKEYEAREFNLNASPLIEGNLLILYVGGKPGACVVALDKNSGKEVWRALDESGTNSTPAVITANGKRQVIVWTQDSVTSLEPLTGKTCWRFPLRTSRDQAISTPVFFDNQLLIAGLMLKLNADPPGASTLWPPTKAVSQRVLSNTSTALFRGDYVFSARSSGQLICLEAKTGRQMWETDKVTDQKGGASIHLTPNGDGVFLYTDRGELIRAQLTPTGYKELARARLLEPTYPFSGRNVAWPPPAYANRHVFARNDKELVCAFLGAKP
jgi:outer membrane protein assembly factor BamB